MNLKTSDVTRECSTKQRHRMSNGAVLRHARSRVYLEYLNVLQALALINATKAHTELSQQLQIQRALSIIQRNEKNKRIKSNVIKYQAIQNYTTSHIDNLLRCVEVAWQKRISKLITLKNGGQTEVGD